MFPRYFGRLAAQQTTEGHSSKRGRALVDFEGEVKAVSRHCSDIELWDDGKKSPGLYWRVWNGI